MWEMHKGSPATPQGRVRQLFEKYGITNKATAQEKVSTIVASMEESELKSFLRDVVESDLKSTDGTDTDVQDFIRVLAQYEEEDASFKARVEKIDKEAGGGWSDQSSPFSGTSPSYAYSPSLYLSTHKERV